MTGLNLLIFLGCALGTLGGLLIALGLVVAKLGKPDAVHLNPANDGDAL